jgi:hypothetical protein
MDYEDLPQGWRRCCLSPSTCENALCLLCWLAPSCGVRLLGVYPSVGGHLLEGKSEYFS